MAQSWIQTYYLYFPLYIHGPIWWIIVCRIFNYLVTDSFFWHYLIIVNIDNISIGGIIINFLYICVKYSSYVGSWTLTLKILLQYLIHYPDINFAFRMFQYLCFLLNSIIWIIIWLSQVFILISYYSPEFLAWLLSLLYFNYLLLIGILIILKSSP